jgi:hypothetical protein
MDIIEEHGGFIERYMNGEEADFYAKQDVE